MDLLYLFITAVCAFFTVLVTAVVVYFTLKFRRRHPDEVGEDIHQSLALELTWTIIPFVLAMIMFAWGAKLFFDLSRPPPNAMDIYVVGKQGMWKVQHSDRGSAGDSALNIGDRAMGDQRWNRRSGDHAIDR